jgi:hypothetical protein
MLVQSELNPDLIDHIFGGVGTRQYNSGITGKHSNDGEDDQGDPEKNRNHDEESSDDILTGHICDSPPMIKKERADLFFNRF